MVDDDAFKVGELVEFSGVADDLGSPIAAIEFSFDGGPTWTTCETTGADAKHWVNWSFATTFDEPGDYEVIAQARTADGEVSPLSASVRFTVE